MEITEITDPERKSADCTAVIGKLGAWFGIPTSNERYVREIASKDVFAAVIDDRTIGLIALRYHFRKTAEIWWMGIIPQYHRKGIGQCLSHAARGRALQVGCTTMAVMTLSPRNPDQGYADTRAFYERQGFQLLVEFNEDDPRNPLVRMVLPLSDLHQKSGDLRCCHRGPAATAATTPPRPSC